MDSHKVCGVAAMALIAIVAEGPSEQQFITNNLAPYLQQASGGNLFAQAIVVKTSVAANGKARFGGGGWYSGARTGYDSLIRMLLEQPQWQGVSTMIDYYGFPQDFIRKAGLVNPRCEDIEEKLLEYYRNREQPGKWLPFVVKHEFESLVIAAALHGKSTVFSNAEIHQMTLWKDAAGEVEEINDSPQTAPSKRIIQLKESSPVPYRKLPDTKEVFDHTRIEAVMDECPHFAGWVENLLSFAP